MDLGKIIFNKDDLYLKKMETNHYILNFNIQNVNILLSNIINFELIKLIYDLNNDVYEKVIVDKNKEDDNKCIITLLLKHFFEDLGFPQRFSFIQMNKTIDENKIIFKSQSIKTHKPLNIPTDAELMSMNKMICICEILTPHKIAFSIDMTFDTETNIPLFVEKMMGVIIHKMFKRVKQFIENIRI